jgi:hypothetical protein
METHILWMQSNQGPFGTRYGAGRLLHFMLTLGTESNKRSFFYSNLQQTPKYGFPILWDHGKKFLHSMRIFCILGYKKDKQRKKSK